MSVSQDDKLLAKPHTFIRYEEGDNTWDNMGELLFLENTTYNKCPTYIQKTPPCQGSCPPGEDICGWLQIVRGIEKPSNDMSMQKYAFRCSTAANPFPSMKGRVCSAPCEEGCNRNDVVDFVGINAVEQYIGYSAVAAGLTFDDSATPTGKKKPLLMAVLQV